MLRHARPVRDPDAPQVLCRLQEGGLRTHCQQEKRGILGAGRVLRGGYLSYRRLRHEERPRPGLQNGVGQEILVHGLYRQYPYHLYVDPGRLRTGAGLHLLRLQLQKAWPQCP